MVRQAVLEFTTVIGQPTNEVSGVELWGGSSALSIPLTSIFSPMAGISMKIDYPDQNLKRNAVVPILFS